MTIGKIGAAAAAAVITLCSVQGAAAQSLGGIPIREPGAGLASGSGASATTLCQYRLRRPVWHFIPALQIEDDAYFAQSRADNYRILREGGGTVTQRQLLKDLSDGENDARFFAEAMRAIRGLREGVSNETTIDLNAVDPTALEACRQSIREIADANDVVLDETEIDQAISGGQVSEFPDCGEITAPALTKNDDDDGENNDARIQGLADNLTEFTNKSSDPGLDPSAPIPYGAPLNPGWHYARVTVAQSNLSYDRRFWRKYFPALYTELQFDSFGRERKAIGISAEDAHYRHDKNRVGRTLVMNQVVLPPTPYIDGEMRAEMSILAVESYDYGRAFMSFLSNVTNGLSSKLLSQAENVFNILDEGIRQLAGTDAEKQFLEAGIAIDWPRPRTGYWLLVWPNKDFLKAYAGEAENRCETEETPKTSRGPWAPLIQNRTGGRTSFAVNDVFKIVKTGPSEIALLAGRNRDGRGQPTHYEPFDNASWALLRVDALVTNPNWQRIPGLIEARQKIVERMLQFYLPNFARSGTYLDQAELSVEAKKLREERDELLAGENAEFAAQLAQLEDQEAREKFFQEELTKDYQFYYGLLMSSPDLLSSDKYLIIDREQRQFQRHLHVLRTTELREQLISEGYKDWRNREKKTACETIYSGVTPPAGSICLDANGAPPVEPAPTEGEEGSPPTDDDENPETPGGSPTASLSAASPRATLARYNAGASRAGAALTAAVDKYMARYPHLASTHSYSTIGDVDGALINRVGDRASAGEVRAQTASFLTHRLMVDWLSDPLAHMDEKDRRTAFAGGNASSLAGFRFQAAPFASAASAPVPRD